MNTKITILKTLIAILFVFPLVSISQTSISNSFFLNLSPLSPAPGSEFSAQVTSSAFDVRESNIRWLVDGATQSSGVGNSFISLRAPEVGSSMTIDVSITTPNNVSLSRRIVVRPVGVRILWETETYTPPFYKGKALYSYRSPVKVVAIPQTSSSNQVSFIGRDNLNYRWALNRDEIQGLSGFGKNTFEFTPSEITAKSILVSVNIFDSSENLLGSNSIIIAEEPPEIVFYEENPLLGKISNRTIKGNYILNKDEVSIKVEPFYFSLKDLDENKLNFDWRLNKQSFSTVGDKTSVTLGKGEGISLIELSIQNPVRVIQKAFSGFRITNE